MNTNLWLDFLRLEAARDEAERDELELIFLRALLSELFPNG